MDNKIGTLYVIGLPIGNVKDLTLRSREILEKIKLFACEDTREFRRLLKELSIPQDQELISFFEHTERIKTPELIQRLNQGEDLGLVVSHSRSQCRDHCFSHFRASL
ncbi:MAG: hypothetical protein HYW85_02175 [Deltaproteobacteria bacterium]|nr:hypothetical protein [Deltaproteobacteria bacterium]